MQANNIGTKYSRYYLAHSNALLKRGDGPGAVKMLNSGIKQKAHPLQMLQKRVQELKELNNRQESTQKQETSAKAAIPLAMMDEKVCQCTYYL